MGLSHAGSSVPLVVGDVPVSHIIEIGLTIVVHVSFVAATQVVLLNTLHSFITGLNIFPIGAIISIPIDFISTLIPAHLVDIVSSLKRAGSISTRSISIGTLTPIFASEGVRSIFFGSSFVDSPVLILAIPVIGLTAAAILATSVSPLLPNILTSILSRYVHTIFFTTTVSFLTATIRVSLQLFRNLTCIFIRPVHSTVFILRTMRSLRVCTRHAQASYGITPLWRTS